MEEITKTNATENQKNAEAQSNHRATEIESTESKPLTEEEMLVKIAEAEARAKKAEAENQKLQNKNNALSSENAEQKRVIRARQTAEEREAEEKAEAQRLNDEEKEAMRKELNHIKAVAAYKNIPDEKTVENLIAAIDENDHVSINTIFEAIKEKAVKEAVKEAKAEWERTTPPVQHGTGEYSSMTVEEAMKIPDRERRLKALAQITR